MNKKQSALVRKVPSASWNFIYLKLCFLKDDSPQPFRFNLCYFKSGILSRTILSLHTGRHPLLGDPQIGISQLQGDLPKPSPSRPHPKAPSPFPFYFEANLINHTISSINILACFSKRESIAPLINKIKLSLIHPGLWGDEPCDR